MSNPATSATEVVEIGLSRLREVFSGRHHLVALHEDAPMKHRGIGTDAAGDAAWVTQLNSDGYGVYFVVNEVKQDFQGSKPKKTDIALARALHVDIDDASEVTRAKIAAFRPAPTLVVFSGGGYHVYWRLAEPIDDLARVEDINRRLEQALGGDHCHNIDRIMRAPGTINWPSAKKRDAGREPADARIEEGFGDPSASYRLEEFDHVPGREISQHGPAMAPVPMAIQIVGIDVIGLNPSDPLAAIIETGDDPERPRTQRRARFKSRSEAVWYAICHLLRRRVPAEVVLGLLLNPDLGISASILEKPNPEAIAWRQIQKAQAKLTEGWPETRKDGRPIKSVLNALVALERLDITFEYDRFHNRKRIGGHDLQEYAGDLTDDVVARLHRLIIDRFEFDPGKGHLLDAVNMLCVSKISHPINDYLDGLEWDGVRRIGSWLTDYLGADNSELNSAIGQIVLVAAVRRIRQPGVKFDMMMVLEGAQGSGKSSSIQILAGPENFSDQNVLVLDDKAQMEAVEGVWLYEIAELDGMRHAETSKIKAFLSRTEDRGRPAYARFKERWPRQCVFIGTTNDDFYLKDQTGNRRFLPVATRQIDLEALRRDRDQLWAEAEALEADDHSTNLPPELWTVAAEAQTERVMADPFEDPLSRLEGRRSGGFERVHTKTIFEFLEIPVSQRKQYQDKQIAAVMRGLGWTGPKKVRVNGEVARGYERPSNESDNPELPNF